MKVVTSEDIEKVDRYLPENVVAFKGTMNHEIGCYNFSISHLCVNYGVEKP